MTRKVLLLNDDIVLKTIQHNLFGGGGETNTKNKTKKKNSRFRDSNPEPFDPGARALTTELRRLTSDLFF